VGGCGGERRSREGGEGEKLARKCRRINGRGRKKVAKKRLSGRCGQSKVGDEVRGNENSSGLEIKSKGFMKERGRREAQGRGKKKGRPPSAEKVLRLAKKKAAR